MKLRRKTPEPSKGYLDPNREPSDPCTCRWVSLGGEPWSVNTDTILVKEGQTLPPVDRGFVSYCPRHGGDAA